MSSGNSTCSLQESNPDISGVGIRTSFYLQNFVLVLLVNRSWRDAPGALWTFIATSFGLTLSALVQTTVGELSLFEAVAVSYLVWLANAGVFLALASYSRQKDKASGGNVREESARRRRKRSNKSREVVPHDSLVMISSVAQTILSMILTLVMWAKAKTFGNKPECNEQLKFVLFFATIPATTSGRIVGLAITSLLSVVYFFITGHELRRSRRARRWFASLRKWFRRGRLGQPQPPDLRLQDFSFNVNTSNQSGRRLQPHRREHNQPDANMNALTVVVPRHITVSSASSTNSGNSGHSRQISAASDVEYAVAEGDTRRDGLRSPMDLTSGEPYRRDWTRLDGTFLGTIVFQFAVFAYFITCNELYLHRNPSEGDDGVWGFGQILAVVVTIPSLVSTLRAFKEHGLSHVQKVKPKPKKSTRPNV